MTTASPGSPTGPAAAPSGRRRWLVVALGASLALNLGLGGLLAGAHLRARAWDGGGSLGHVLRKGDADERARAHAVLQARRPGFDAGRAEVARARAGVRAAALAEPYDPAALAAALAGLRAAEAALAAERHDAFAELAAGLGPERRAELIERMERRDGRKGHDRRGRDD